MTEHTAAALRRKRDEISGTIAHYEKALLQAQHDLAHINAALRLFEGNGDGSKMPAYIDLGRVLRRGELTKICIEALTNEGPLDTRELAMRVIRAKGLSDSDKVLTQSMTMRVIQALRIQVNRGRLINDRKVKGRCVWEVPSVSQNTLNSVNPDSSSTKP